MWFNSHRFTGVLQLPLWVLLVHLKQQILLRHMKLRHVPMDVKKLWCKSLYIVFAVFEESQLPYLTSMSGKLVSTRILTETKHEPETDGYAICLRLL